MPHDESATKSDLRRRRRDEKRERRRQLRDAYGSSRGDRRPHAGRVLIPMRLPAHRTTTANLQAVYPFIVESGLGSDGAYVGREAGSGASFVYDPWHLYQQQVITNANILLAGVLGRGKSALAKTLAYRLGAFGVRAYVPCDPKGEWGILARALGSEPLELGRGMPTRINPLDPGQRPLVSKTRRGSRRSGLAASRCSRRSRRRGWGVRCVPRNGTPCTWPGAYARSAQIELVLWSFSDAPSLGQLHNHWERYYRP